MSTSRRACAARRRARRARRRGRRAAKSVASRTRWTNVADVGAAGHRGEQRRRRRAALRPRRRRRRRGGRRRRRAPRRRRRASSGSLADRRLVRAGGDVAVGGAPPARVEARSKRAAVELDGAGAARRPTRVGRPSVDALDRDRARARRPRAPRSARRPRRRRACASPARRRRCRRRRARRAAGRAASCGCPTSPPTRRPPGAARGSARRRRGAGPRRAPRARAGGGGAAKSGPVHADVDRRARRPRRGRGRRPAGLVAGSSRAPTGTGSRRSGTRGPCCGGSSGPAPPRRRTRARRLRSSSLVSSSASAIRWRSQAVSAVTPELLGRRRGVQQLADVAQVGEPALAVDACAAPARAGPRSSVIVSSSDATPLDAQHARPAVQAARGAPPRSSSSAAATCSAVQPRKRRERGRACARAAETGARAPRAAAASRAPARCAKTLPAPLMTAGTPTSSSASRTSAAVAVGADEHGDVAGPDAARAAASAPSWRARSRSRRPRRAARRRRRRGPSATCSRARALLDAYPCACQLDRRLVAVHDPDAQRRGDGRAAQPRRLVGVRGPDRAVDDALVAELGAAEQRVVGVEQPLVAAPVTSQRRRVSAARAAASR